MGQLIEHLRSPQFVDVDGHETARRHRWSYITGTGVPRWRAYLFYSIEVAIGLALVVGVFSYQNLVDLLGLVPDWSGSVPSDEPGFEVFDQHVGILAFVGVVILIWAVSGLIDTRLGRPLLRFLRDPG